MIDIHSHILPGMDDGSRSVKESVQMLEAAARQGVDRIVATSHFYASQDRPEQFLRRREAAEKALRAAWNPTFPEMTLGAEVYYFDGISRTEEIKLLKLQNTELLLLEMPFSAWTERMVSEILELQDRSDTTVLLAHIERYMAYQKPAVWRTLLDHGILMQCNAEYFLNWKTKRKALKLLRRGEIHFLGSDCHNMTTRPPRLGDAMAVIDKALGAEERRRFEQKAAALLAAAEKW